MVSVESTPSKDLVEKKRALVTLTDSCSNFNGWESPVRNLILRVVFGRGDKIIF